MLQFPSHQVLDKRLAASVQHLEAGTYVFERRADGEIVAIQVSAEPYETLDFDEDIPGVLKAA